MINFFKSFIDKITFDALLLTTVLWISVWIAYEGLKKIENSNKIIKNKHRGYIKNVYLIILFVITYSFIKWNMKNEFTDRYLDIFQPLINN